MERAKWEVHELPEHGPSSTAGPAVAAAMTSLLSPTNASEDLAGNASTLGAEIERLLTAAHAALRHNVTHSPSLLASPTDQAVPTPMSLEASVASSFESDAAASSADERRCTAFRWPQWNRGEEGDARSHRRVALGQEFDASEPTAIPARLIVARLASSASVPQLATSDSLLPLADAGRSLVEIRWQGQVRARGTLVAVDGHFGVRITELVPPNEAILS